MLAGVWVVVGIGLLYLGAESLMKGTAGMVDAVGMSAALAGVTVIAFATTAPELSVVLFASFGGAETIGLGTIVGSNVANIGLVLGVSALIRPLDVSSDAIRQHLPFVIVAAVLLVGFGWDGQLGVVAGVVMLVALAGFSFVLVRGVDDEGPNDADLAADGGTPVDTTDAADTGTDDTTAADPRAADAGTTDTVRLRDAVRLRDFAFLFGGVLLLMVGARRLIAGGETLMLAFGASERLVGVTIVALGTSLPELAASVVAALRGENDFSVGNVLGSNVYNVLAVVGLMLFVTGASVPDAMVRIDFPVLLAVTALLAGILLGRRRVSRVAGLGLVAAYVGYVWTLL